MLSFEDTKIAFAGKSNKELKWAYRLFKVMGKPWLVSLGGKVQNLAFKLKIPIQRTIKRTIFRQFCGGETIDDCSRKISQLGEYKVGTILDYSVEGKETDDELDRSKDEIIATIHKARDQEDIPISVFKPTGICRTELLEKANISEENLSKDDLIEWNSVLERVDAICSAASEADVPVFIDAEDSWFQDAIDRMANNMMKKYNVEKAIVFNTIQMYRHDRLEFLKKSHQDAQDEKYILGIKLVRGAYMEKERERAIEKGYRSPIHLDKASTDKDYNSALEYMIQHIETISFCAGTHNEESAVILSQLMEQHGVSKDDKRVYFAQLLGMSDHISFNLAHEGFNVAKYVPYGPVKEVMPYLMRRAKENTSVAGQVGRELSLIIKEKKRRKM
jgi:proline dehydrogenase